MALLRRTNTFFMQRPPIIPTLLFCLVTKVTYKYNNVNYALFLCSLGRLTHCRSQFSLFLPVLRFASSATGGAQLRTSTVRLNVGVCTAPKGATIYGGAVERSETEGEHLAALASSELFPFQLLITFAATFPVNGDSFWVCNTMCQFSPCCIPRSGRSAPAPSPANLETRGLGREINIK